MNEYILTREQVRNCDKVSIEKYAIPGIVLMENAGIAASNIAETMLIDNSGNSVCIISGPGNNGGDGFVVARHLAGRGMHINIFAVSNTEKYKGDALTNLIICQKMDLPLYTLDHISIDSFFTKINQTIDQSDLIIDALLGTGMTTAPREPISTIIDIINSSQKPKLALDIPSGLDCDTGLPLGNTILANETVTFAAMKHGFQNPESQKYTGKITAAGIGINTELLI